MKQIFDWLRGAILDKAYKVYDGTVGVDIHDVGNIINEAESKWESDIRKHDIEVHNKAIAEFEEQMKFEYRESVGTTKRERHFAEAVIEQVAHSLTEVE